MEYFSYKNNKNIVSNFIHDYEKDFQIVTSRIANMNIDIYKSGKLDCIHFIIINECAKVEDSKTVEKKSSNHT